MTGPAAMRPARPTLRCLCDDLGLPLPAVTDPLDEIEHPILAKTAEQFAADDPSMSAFALSMTRCCSR